jgi:hypothetical protein
LDNSITNVNIIYFLGYEVVPKLENNVQATGGRGRYGGAVSREAAESRGETSPLLSEF